MQKMKKVSVFPLLFNIFFVQLNEDFAIKKFNVDFFQKGLF